MLKKILLSFVVVFPLFLFGQSKATISGTVTEFSTGQPVIGAFVILSNKKVAKTNLDGTYMLKDVPYGEYQIKVSSYGFDTIQETIKLNDAVEILDFKMGNTQEMKAVKVVGQIAVDRKTPVAVSRIKAKELHEELGSRDLPMILNSTPGVMATQQGGGDGDARISIRGFNQRNIGVMIDGVPVNDMENGWVYWSNWFGLDQITSQIQVQRGLGATKLAMPSVGGTINIITMPTGGKRMIRVQQQYGTGNYFRTSLSYKSGTLKNGWGVLFSGSYKQGDGWAQGLNTRGAFFYLKVQKKIGKHILSLSGFGAPQEHGQRTYNQKIQYWDTDYARKLGVDVKDGASDTGWGIKHNEHFGYYTDKNGNRIGRTARRNYYFKPQITLKDFWQPTDDVTVSFMAYTSIGRGGGEKFKNSSNVKYDKNNNVDWDLIIHNNQEGILFGNPVTTVDPTYDPNLFKSNQVLASSVNNHIWVGGLAQVDYKITDDWKFSAGLDYRWYKGTHYVELTDLLGGDYFINNMNQNALSPMKQVGDKIGWQPYHDHRDAIEHWAAAFAQVEYAKGRWSAFVNVSGVINGYKGVDYFKKKVVELSDTTLYIGAHDVVNYNGTYYHPTSEEAKYDETPWKWIPGYTIKAGVNFNLNESMNVFLNAGYLSRTPMFSNVINNDDNTFFREILNENIKAIEVGYGYHSRKFSANINAYYTYWQNKPFPFGVSVPDPMDPTEFVRVNVNGMDAQHMGIEFEGVYKILPNLELQGMISFGDWTWQSTETVDVLGTEVTFDARDVHVGDAAQSTYAVSLRYEPIHNLYFKVLYNYFDRYYSDFDPFSLTPASGNGGKESWRIPSYGLLSVYAGYSISISKSTSIYLRGTVFNALNSLYISDAKNDQYGSNFDATSAGVFIGQGVHFNLTLGFEFH